MSWGTVDVMEVNIAFSIMILVVLIVRRLGRQRIPRRMITVLWDVVLLRGLVPYQIPLGKLPVVENLTSNFYHATGTPGVLDFSARTEEAMSGSLALSSSPVLHGESFSDALKLLWGAGAICVCLYFLKMYIQESKMLRKSIPVHHETAERMLQAIKLRRKVRFFENPLLTAPVTYGMLRPKIVLPSDCDGISRADMRNMVAHECVHIQRYDVPKRFLAAAVLCLYWYNPFTWMMYLCFREDQEIACDEGVLRSMSQERKSGYIYTMIKMAAEGGRSLRFTGFWGGNERRNRILAAMNQKKMKKGYKLLMAPVVLLLLLFFVSIKVTPSQGLEAEEKPRREAEAVSETEEFQDFAARLRAKTEELRGFERMSDEEYERVMEDITKNYNDPFQRPTEEQERALQQQRFDQLEEILREIPYSWR